MSGGSSVFALEGGPLRLMSLGLLASLNLPSGTGGRLAKSIRPSLGFLLCRQSMARLQVHSVKACAEHVPAECTGQYLPPLITRVQVTS